MSSISKMAKELQGYGRNGDTVLVHMQPRELKALEQVSGQKATTNPATNLKEGFVFIPFLIALAKAGAMAAAATGAAALTNKLANGGNEDQAQAQESAARKYLNDQAQKAKENYRIPWMQIDQSPTPQPGVMAGIAPEQNLTPIRKPVGWISPGGQVSAPPGYAEGGMIPEQEEASAVMQAVSSGNYDEATLNRFIEIFGEEMLQQVLGQGQQQMATGGLLRGPGGGMDDLIPASVQGKVPVALSGGEYIWPADAVAALGDGNNEAGGRVLDAAVQRTRQMKTGTTQQPGKINLRKALPV